MQLLTEATDVKRPVPKAGGVHHISVTVTDVDASEAWSRKGLGLERAMVEEHDGGHAVVLNRPGTPLFLGIHHHEANDTERFSETRTGLDHLAIHVEQRSELDRWAEHLEVLGVAYSPIFEATEPFPDALIVFRDPDNIQLELIWA